MLAEEVEDFNTLWVVDLEDLWPGEFGAVALVAHWSGIVVGVELVEEHRTGYVNNYDSIKFIHIYTRPVKLITIPIFSIYSSAE